MIVLDTDSFSLHQYGQERFLERFNTAREVPAITIVTQIEALRGRHDSVLKAADGARVLIAQQRLIHTINHLASFEIVFYDGAAALEFDRLRQIKTVRRIGQADLMIAGIALANKALLVTRNVKDFRKVPGLQFANWAD